MTDNPEWYEKACHMRTELGWTHKQIARDLELAPRTVQKRLRGVGKRVETRKPFLSVAPDWLAKAMQLCEQGMTYEQIAIAVRANRDAVARWLNKDDSRTDSKVREARAKIKLKRPPKAGEVNESIMESARLFARGEISREELSNRLRGGAS
jgi:predicted transcriptional regulator